MPFLVMAELSFGTNDSTLSNDFSDAMSLSLSVFGNEKKIRRSNIYIEREINENICHLELTDDSVVYLFMSRVD